MTRSKDEVIQALEYCCEGTGCLDCPYFIERGRCMAALRADVLELVKQLDAELTTMLYGKTIPGKDDKQ